MLAAASSVSVSDGMVDIRKQNQHVSARGHVANGESISDSITGHGRTKYRMLPRSK